jgi:hypothetical protein
MKFDVFNTETKEWVTEPLNWFIYHSGELDYIESCDKSIEHDCIPIYYIELDGVKYRDGDVYPCDLSKDHVYIVRFHEIEGFTVEFWSKYKADKYSLLARNNSFTYMHEFTYSHNEYENPELLDKQ